MKYRISHTLDPEERLEDAAMANAMHNALGVEIVAEGPAEFGRDLMFRTPRKNIAYWDDPAFLENAGRPVKTLDADGAEAEVERLHSLGKGAFVKATDLKLFALPVPVGTSFVEALGDYIWSVIDRPACIMVQPLCDVRFEMRFVSVGRQIVTCSPVAVHLTPICKPHFNELYETPRSAAPTKAPCHKADLSELAENVAKQCRWDNAIIDCAIIDGKPAVIEFNPFNIGNFGLYACDPHAIAQAYAKQLECAQ